ncbi:secondary thiamine-phosphate synthase enzyme YjbQ [Desulfobacterales bacterium HSG16]|nr:secondary thiamine-phosphate synthase enzyme YjbQ [Desulfobacterales bacterium HSG16]
MLLSIKSDAKTQFIDITSKVAKIVGESKITNGFCHIFVPHTTAGVTINESADPSVKKDILMILNRMVPDNADAEYRHMEGNSPAHIKSTLTGVSVIIAIEDGRLILGTWQGIFFCEYDGPRNRKMHVRISTQI